MKISIKKTFAENMFLWNIFLPYTYCAIKFANVVVPSIVVENVFLRCFENSLSYWLQAWQYWFSQPKEATSILVPLGLAPLNAGDTFGHDNTEYTPKNVGNKRNDDKENHNLYKDRRAEVVM